MKKIVLTRKEWIIDTYETMLGEKDWESFKDWLLTLSGDTTRYNHSQLKSAYKVIKDLSFSDVVAMFEGEVEFPEWIVTWEYGEYTERLDDFMAEYMREDAINMGPVNTDYLDSEESFDVFDFSEIVGNSYVN